MNFIWYNIILSRILNWFIAPIAYLLRDYAQKNKNFLWWFLSDDNMYGDKNWRPKLKNKALRAIVWMYRNPLQNYYWKDYIDGVESDFHGEGMVKFGNDIITWRTMRDINTGENHGKLLDFINSPFGKQNITFIRTDKYNNIKKCYRKSTCMPYKVGPWIVLAKRRSGHEHGLMQYNFTFPIFNYKKNKDGWELWRKADWKIITI